MALIAGARPSRGSLAVGETTLGLLSACSRLLELLDTPEDIPFLSHLIQRKIVYCILRTPQAERLRAIATSGDLSQRTTRAIAWLRANFAKPLHMDDLFDCCSPSLLSAQCAHASTSLRSASRSAASPFSVVARMEVS
jgi:hypothetical protein